MGMLKKKINWYNILSFICIILIIVSIYIIIKPEKKISSSGIEIIQTGIKDGEEISEEDAKKVAVKQFKILGEKTKTENIKVEKIRREKEEYYYITSAENSLEIRINGGIIERINSVLIEL